MTGTLYPEVGGSQDGLDQPVWLMGVDDGRCVGRDRQHGRCAGSSGDGYAPINHRLAGVLAHDGGTHRWVERGGNGQPDRDGRSMIAKAEEVPNVTKVTFRR